jgi:hypothetical protein
MESVNDFVQLDSDTLKKARLDLHYSAGCHLGLKISSVKPHVLTLFSPGKPEIYPQKNHTF